MESWMSDEENPKYRQQHNFRNIQYSFDTDGKRKVWRGEENREEVENRIAPSRLDPRLSKTIDYEHGDSLNISRKDPRLNQVTKKDDKERNSFDDGRKDPRITSFLDKIRNDSPNINRNYDNENKSNPTIRKDPRLLKGDDEELDVKEKRGPRSPPSPPVISNSSRKWRRDHSESSSPDNRRDRRDSNRRERSPSPRRSRRRSRSHSPMQTSWKPSSPPQPPPPPRYNHPPPRQYNMFNEGGYNNNYGQQNQGYGFQSQQAQNYGFGNYYQQSMYQPGYPPPPPPSSGGTSQPWQNNMVYPDISQPPPIAPPPSIVQPPPTGVPPPIDKNAEEAKKEAAVEKEMLHQKQTLTKQREEYIRKSLIISRELKLLKEQEAELIEENSKENLRFLKENTKLQVEIQTRLKAINNVIDMLTGIIGDGKRSNKLIKDDNKPDSSEGFENHFLSSNLTSNPISEFDKSQDSNGYIYFDPENHWCRICNVFPKTAKDLLNHLHSQEHKNNLQEKKISDTPWHNLPPEKEAIPPKGITNKRVPIRGIQFFISATSWFCKLCNSWMGDLHCASLHLKSKIHLDNYEAYLDKNPKWESDWLHEREKALERNPNEKHLEIEDIYSTNKKKKERSKKKSKKSSDDKKKKRSKKRTKSKKVKKSSDSSSSGSSSSTSSSETSDEESYKDDEGDDPGLRSIRVAMRNKGSSRNSFTSDTESKWHSIQEKQQDNEKEELEQEVKEMQEKIRQVKELEERHEKDRKIRKIQEDKDWSSPEEKQTSKEKFRSRQDYEREKERKREERERERYYERKSGRRRSESPPVKRYRDDRSPDERRYRRDYDRSPKRDYRRYEEFDRPEPTEKKFDKPPGPMSGSKPKKPKKPPPPPTQLNIPKSKLPFIGRMPVLKNLAKKKENEKSDDSSPKGDAEVRSAVTVSGPAKTEVQDMEIDEDSNGGGGMSPLENAEEESTVHYDNQVIPEEEYMEGENSILENVNPSGFEDETLQEDQEQKLMPMMILDPPPMPQEIPPPIALDEKKDIPLPQDFQEALNIIFPGQKIPGDKQWAMGPNGVMIPTGYQSMDGQVMYDAYGNTYCTQENEGDDADEANESNSEQPEAESTVVEEEEEELGENAEKLKPELDGVDDLALLGIDAEDLAAQSF